MLKFVEQQMKNYESVNMASVVNAQFSKRLTADFQVKAFPEEISHVERTLGENAVQLKLGVRGLREVLQAREKEQNIRSTLVSGET